MRVIEVATKTTLVYVALQVGAALASCTGVVPLTAAVVCLLW